MGNKQAKEPEPDPEESEDQVQVATIQADILVSEDETLGRPAIMEYQAEDALHGEQSFPGPPDAHHDEDHDEDHEPWKLISEQGAEVHTIAHYEDDRTIERCPPPVQPNPSELQLLPAYAPPDYNEVTCETKKQMKEREKAEKKAMKKELKERKKREKKQKKSGGDEGCFEGGESMIVGSNSGEGDDVLRVPTGDGVPCGSVDVDTQQPVTEDVGRTRAQRCRSCCLKVTAFLCSTVGLTSLLVGYTILGGVIFVQLEAGHERQLKLNVKATRQWHIDRLWNITEELNVLYRENWTELADEVLESYTLQVYIATKVNGWDGKTEGGETELQWNFAGALLYSITVITTIGKYSFKTCKTNAFQQTQNICITIV